MTDDNKTRWIAAITDHLRFVAALSVTLSLLGTGMWWTFGPRIEESARDLVGTNELKEIVIEQGERINGATIALDGLSQRVERLEPAPAVAEYDILRSAIDSECAPGDICHYTYRVRRTDEGESCGAPSAQRILIDAAGTTFFPGNGGARPPQRITTEWAVISSTFRVPRRVVEGVAEFNLQITYPDCNRDELGRVVVVEESPSLIFNIRRQTP